MAPESFITVERWEPLVGQWWEDASEVKNLAAATRRIAELQKESPGPFRVVETVTHYFGSLPKLTA